MRGTRIREVPIQDEDAILYRRRSELTVVTHVCHASPSDILKEIEACLSQALAARLLAANFSGNVAAFVPVLKAYLVTCLKSKVSGTIGDVDLCLRRRRRVTSDWKAV